MWMLDTNVCIALIKRQPPGLIQHIRRRKVGEIVLSSITLAELRYGASKSRQVEQNQSALDQFLLPFQLMSFDDAAAECYGRVRAALEQGGTPIGPLDALIASHALSVHATIVTNNTREFQRVAGLKVEDWLAESSPGRGA